MNDLNTTLDKLKDIKSSSVLQIDFLPYILISLAVLAVIVLLIGLFIYIKNKKNKRPTKIQIAKQNLKNMDFSKDTKDIVYKFTINAYECLDDNNKDELEQIVRKLEPYKYKKVVTKISIDLLDDMKDYIKVRV